MARQEPAHPTDLRDKVPGVAGTATGESAAVAASEEMA